MEKQKIKKDFGKLTYEEFCVYEALSKNSKNTKVPFKSDVMVDGFAWPPDIYAPEGIPSLEIAGETVIEVKNNLSYAILNRFQNYIETHIGNYNIVVVYFNKTLSSVPEPFERNGKKVMYVSFTELLGGRNITTKSEEKFYSEKVKKTDWKKEREDVIEKAKIAVQQLNNVLFLGAGVSMSAEMPSWNKLLEGLMSEVKQLKEPTLSAFMEMSSHVLEECGDSYLIMARYLQTAIHQYDEKANFSELIQKHLYGGKKTSNLLEQLSSIIQQKKVNEVITYNFDDVLEQTLQANGYNNTEDFTSISKDAEIKSHNTLPIYHVHGIIPENGPTDTVVFSEEEYHNRYANSYHWSNVEQLHALSRMHCFFVGLSMSDPNLRRLLDVAHRMNCTDEIPHFAFLKRTKLEDYCVSSVDKTCKYVHVSKSLIDEKKQKEIYDLNYGVIENIFRELGVQVIWYEEHDDLPELLAEVFEMSKYKIKETKELMDICKSKIGDIKNIEEGIPTFNPAKLDASDVLAFLQYKSEHGEQYRELVQEVSNMLVELSDRVKIDGATLLKLQKQAPKYNDSFSGFASFYGLWLDYAKICLEK